ncbi:MAG TPA: hypothetical protein DCR04_08865 [Flavobacteriales bacterium]|nr:hypothetical protein [Flavobacteriales bacterium]
MASFESAIEKEDKPSFIYIKESKDEQMRGREDDGRFKEMQSRMLDFLKDSNLITVLNENFNCYRFDLAADSIVFKGVTYKKGEQRGRTSHEFVPVLTDSDRNRLPAVVIRDKTFKLYEFKMRPSQLEEMKILLAAEKLKVNYLEENLAEDSKLLSENSRTLERAERQVKSEEANLEKLDKSIFSGRQEASSLIKKLNYFLDEAFKEMDLQTYEGL